MSFAATAGACCLPPSRKTTSEKHIANSLSRALLPCPIVTSPRTLPHDDPLSPSRRATLRASFAVSSIPATGVSPMLGFETKTFPQIFTQWPARVPATNLLHHGMPTTGSNTLGPLPRACGTYLPPPRARCTSLNCVLSSPTAVPLFREGFPPGRPCLPLGMGR